MVESKVDQWVSYWVVKLAVEMADHLVGLMVENLVELWAESMVDHWVDTRADLMVAH